MQEKENVLRILEETKAAIRDNDSYKIKELSNQTIHTASITQDPDNIAVAVAVYSISKIVERKEYRDFAGWKDFYKTIISAVDLVWWASRQNHAAWRRGTLDHRLF